MIASMFCTAARRAVVAGPSRVARARVPSLARTFASSGDSSALVLGGSGSLGRSLVSQYAENGWNTVSIDITENTDAASNIKLDASHHWKEHVQAMEQELGAREFDAIVCCAGGWAGGTLESDALFSSVELMLQLNLFSALSAGRLATKCLAPNGLVVLTGAAAAEEGTPGMIAYGISKAATHQIVRSLAVPGTLKDGCTALGVLPLTIDTPSNRAGMPNEDFSNWTPPSVVAAKVFQWQQGHRPRSGSLVKVETRAGESTWTVVSRGSDRND